MVRLPAFCVPFLRIHVSLFRISSHQALAMYPLAFALSVADMEASYFLESQND